MLQKALPLSQQGFKSDLHIIVLILWKYKIHVQKHLQTNIKNN